ncbi:MAG: ACT domain-containing protein [Victivallales bacterium]|nr:ACT domain-containing protein [Victivallales bacterium]
MLAPITAGISSEFDPFMDAADAKSFLEERGIDYRNRVVDNSKHYGESITVDLFEGNENINQVSVRGTLTENHLMISRLNNFDRLYLEPTGHNLFVEYSDEPGVIGKIASILGDKNINIIDIRAPQDLSRNRSLAVIKTSVKVPEELLAKIKITVRANVAFCFSYS